MAASLRTIYIAPLRQRTGPTAPSPLPRRRPSRGVASPSPPTRSGRVAARYHPRDPQPKDITALSPEEQRFLISFQLLDRDGDGLISQAEAWRLLAYASAARQRPSSPAGLQQPQPQAQNPPQQQQQQQQHWDEHLTASIAAARARGRGGVRASLARFLHSKLSGTGRGGRLSDIVWGAVGMGITVACLTALATHAPQLPIVGPMHAQGLPLLLGSFGTMAILLFARPESAPVRLWSVVAGQLAAAVIAVAFVKAFGTGVAARAAAMAVACAVMMQLDAVHPPGGALVLLAMDNRAVQALDWGFVIWPSLALTLFLVLPLAALTNMLKRSCPFDWPFRDVKARAEAAAKAEADALDAAGGAGGAGGGWVRPGGPSAWRASMLAPPGVEPGCKQM